MKIKYALFIISLAITSHAFCGDKNAKNDKKEFKRVYIGVSFTPEATYRYLHSNYTPTGTNNPQDPVEYGNKHSTPAFGLNAAVKVGINLTHWLAIESGVGYSLSRYQYKADRYYTSNLLSGVLVNQADSFQTADRETYQFLAVPVGLRFSMGHRKVRGIIAAGVDLDFLIQQNSRYTYTYADGSEVQDRKVQTSNFNTFNVSPYLGVGIDCYLSQVVVLRIMPQAQIQGLKNINAPITEYLWNAGINFSLLFGL